MVRLAVIPVSLHEDYQARLVFVIGTISSGVLVMCVQKSPRSVGLKNQRERGASIVEFGLIILPMFAMLLLTIDVGWALFAWASIQEAVREGVRFAVTGQVLAGHPSQADSIRQVVIQYSFGFVNSKNVNSAVAVQYLDPNTFSSSTNSPGNVVKVTISGISVTPMAPLWRSSTPLSLSASSSDIIEPNSNKPPSP